MRYLFWGVLSLFIASCSGTSADVCREYAGPTGIEASRSMDRVTAKSREATVELASITPEGIAYGTGTLFKYKAIQWSLRRLTSLGVWRVGYWSWTALKRHLRA